MIFYPLNSDWTGKEAWKGVHPDLNALREIVGQVLRIPTALCGPPVAIQEQDYGNCGRIYSFQLPTRAVVARLVAPVKPLFKTESEIAAMDFVRSHTTLPVPEVFSYCSEADNPVGAEWIIMEHVPGKEMSDVWDNLSLTQKLRLARDVVDLHAQLSELKADGCGGIYHNVQSVDDFNLSRTPRWRPLSQDSLKQLREYCPRSLKDGYKLGPLQSVSLVNYRIQVPSPAQTLPVYSAEEYANLVANNGHPSTRSYYELFVRAKCVELFRCVAQLYPQSPIFGPPADSSGYCFTHGDLHEGNIFVDPNTGAITGIVDWESAAFRPIWTEVCGVGWFDEDRERFIFGDEERSNFEHDTEEDTRLRALFRTELSKRDNDLFVSFLGGTEFRAILHACADLPRPEGHPDVFLVQYAEEEWNEKRRGPFPWDMLAWRHRRITLEKELMRRNEELNELVQLRDGSVRKNNLAKEYVEVICT